MCWNVAIWAVLKSPVSWFFLLGGYTTLYMLGVYHKIGIPMTPPFMVLWMARVSQSPRHWTCLHPLEAMSIFVPDTTSSCIAQLLQTPKGIVAGSFEAIGTHKDLRNGKTLVLWIWMGYTYIIYIYIYVCIIYIVIYSYVYSYIYICM